MSTGTQCPNCEYVNQLASNFCPKCGHSLMPATVSCKVCGADNLPEFTFCESCGANMLSSLDGLYLDRAMLWRDLFNEVGWCAWSDFDANEWEMINQLALPQVDDKQEPWIFGTLIDAKDFKPTQGKFNGKLYGFKLPWSFYRGILIATRCRLAVLNATHDNRANSRSNFAKAWNFTDITQHSWKSNQLTIKTHDGDTLEFVIKLPRVGLVNTAMYLWSSDDVGRRIAYERGQAATTEQRSFIDVMSRFLKEISLR